MKNKVAKEVQSVVLLLAGFALTTYAVNWEAALGLFLALWGNNISINNGR